MTTYLQKQDILNSKGSFTWTLINCLLSETSWDLTNCPALVLLDTQGILFMGCRWINPFKPLYTLFLAGYICISALIFPYTRTRGETHIQALTKKRVVCDSILFRDTIRDCRGEIGGYFYCAHSPHIHVTLVDTCDSEWQTRQTCHLSMRLCKILYVICMLCFLSVGPSCK